LRRFIPGYKGTNKKKSKRKIYFGFTHLEFDFLRFTMINNTPRNELNKTAVVGNPGIIEFEKLTVTVT